MPATTTNSDQFVTLCTQIGLRLEHAKSLWQAGIQNPTQLASYDIENLKPICNNPLLINVIMPQLHKYVFKISIAEDPYKCVFDIFHANTGETDTEMIGIESDGQAFVEDNSSDVHKSYTEGNSIDVPLKAQGVYPSDTGTGGAVGGAMNSENATSSDTTASAPPRGATGTSRIHFNDTNTYRSANVSGNVIEINGGNFVQANIMGNTVIHNTNSQIYTNLSEGPLDERRKLKLNSEFFMNGRMFPTASLNWSNGPDYLLNNIDVHPAPTEQYDEHFADQSVYRIDNWGENQALIINNITFKNISKREGADKDTVSMKKMAEDLGFKATAHENKEANFILEIFQEFAKSQSLHKASMIMVYIGSHGERNAAGQDVFTGTDNKRIKVDDILDLFSNANCPALRNKPKLFFFQFCRENRSTQGDRGASSQAPQHGMHKHSDMLVSFATQPGTQAYRDTSDGSWFVTSLVRAVQDYACKEDLLSLLTRTNHTVSLQQGKNGQNLVVQMSEFTSNLRKKVMFFPKQRN